MFSYIFGLFSWITIPYEFFFFSVWRVRRRIFHSTSESHDSAPTSFRICSSRRHPKRCVFSSVRFAFSCSSPDMGYQNYEYKLPSRHTIENLQISRSVEMFGSNLTISRSDVVDACNSHVFTSGRPVMRLQLSAHQHHLPRFPRFWSAERRGISLLICSYCLRHCDQFLIMNRKKPFRVTLEININTINVQKLFGTVIS